MDQLALLAVQNPKLVSWLTPIWLIGVGIILGLLLLVLIWAVALALSRIRFVGTLADDPWRLLSWSSILTLLVGGVGILLVAIFYWSDLSGGETGSTMASLGRLASLSIPTLTFLWLGIAGGLILVSRRTLQEMPWTLGEGVLFPVLAAALFLTGFGFMGFFVAENPLDMIKALGRWNAVGTEVVEFTLKGDGAQSSAEGVEKAVVLQERPVTFRVNEIRSLLIRTDQRISVTRDADSWEAFGQTVEVLPNAAKTDQLFVVPLMTLLASSRSGETVETLQFGNLTESPAKVAVTVNTSLVYPQVWVIPWTAGCLVLLFLAYVLQRMAFPRISAVALSTYKSEVAQPFFIIALLVGALSLIIFIWIPYNTFGEDIKMLKDTGLTLIMVLSILVALWAASTSVSEEIDGRTALTVLSKPLTRRSFVLGKFLGITWTVALMFILLGVVFLLVVAYKPIFDAKESARMIPPWQVCFQEMMHVVPGLVLAFMETLVLAALSVAISTRLPLLANFTICFSIYALGHLTPMIVQSSMGSFPIVRFFGQLIATIFPNLDHFNIQAAVAAGVAVPSEYLGWTFVYCLIYTVIALLLALVMFEDRDLA
ncbi:MAG TPA: ABC transporter permease [Planctomycetes bacterium]|nr:ABC transporter permease [Planctomycetota bacterium]